MSWQVPVSFNTEEEDHIRDRIPHESTKELQQKVRDLMKDAVLNEVTDE